MNVSVPAVRRTIHETFSSLRARGRIALIPFIPAGYPDLETTAALLPALESAGADLIEVGFPFSDPIADGPTIQAAYTAALEKKIRLKDIFAALGAARALVSLPLVAMVSYSVVYRYGLERFVSQSVASGIDALLLPDLPPPEAEDVCAAVRSAGLESVLLVAPTTPPHRRAEIARLSSGFIYYLSVSGITGERQALPADLADNVRQLKSTTDRPVCVGFGISRPEHVRELSAVADGAIVGSAIVRQIKRHESEGPERIAEAVTELCRELAGGAD